MPVARNPTWIGHGSAGLGAYFGPDGATYGFTFGSVSGSFTDTGTVAGFAIPVGLAVGRTLSSHFVLGAGTYFAGVPVLEQDARPRVVMSAMAVLDYYFGNIEGVRLQLGAGPGTSVEQNQSTLALAPAVMAGFGYEWPLSPDLNLGVTARAVVLIEQNPSTVPGALATIAWL